MIEYTHDNPLRVITLFSGYDSQCLALERLKRQYPDFDYTLVAWSEIDAAAIKAHDALFPRYKGLNLGDICKVDWEKAPDCDLITWSFPCFVAGTLVLTDKGYRTIETITTEDKVLTHTNNFRNVTRTMSRRYCNMIYTLTIPAAHTFVCTENHPLYVRRMYRKGHNGDRTFDAPQWLSPKDMMHDLTTDRVQRTLGYHIGYAINTEAKLPQWNGTTINHWGHLKEEDRLSDMFNISEFWYIMGRYVGDGWKRASETSKGIVICCGGRYENELTSALNKLSLHYSVAKERTVRKYHICSKELYEFVERYGYYAYGKHIDIETMSLPVALLKSFINGLMESDGYVASTGVHKISSVSEKLVYGIGQCVAKAYHRPFSIYKTKRPSKVTIENRVCNQRDTYTIAWKENTSKQDRSFYENGYVWMPILKLEWAKTRTIVYNLEVEDDNSYTAFGLIAHNCTNLSSAGQQAGMAEGSGTASSLAWEALKAIRIKRPRYALMENVKALISKQFIGDFKRLMSVLESYGYTNYVPLNKNGEYTTLNASDYGVPQNRERVFMVSILGGSLFEYHFPKPFPLKKRLKDILEDEVAESYYLSDERVQGLIQSTLKEKAANRGFEFKPKSVEDDTANTLTGGCVTRKTDNFIVCGAIRGRKDSPDDEKHHLELELNSATESNTITSVQKDNVVVIGNSPDVANTVTSHYAKEKTSDLVRQSFGKGSYVMERKDEQGIHNH